TFMGPTTVDGTITTQIPGNAVREGAALTMFLDVSGGTDQEDHDGATDFSNTAKFMSILIADANGGYIPGSENLRIVGENSFNYETITPLTVPTTSADFDEDDDVDGADFLAWQRGFGLTSAQH